MKIIFGTIIAIILGLLIGFYGVLVSVFADCSMKERILSIGVILLIYLILGMIWGWISPKQSWKWGLYIGMPGSIILLIYSFAEVSMLPYFILYIGGILTITCFGAYVSAKGKS